MKQQEKTQRTQERILSAALAEFGAKGYEAASVSAVCSESQVPKGLFYHNFKNKDDLYIRCLARCCSGMAEYLRAQEKACGGQGDIRSLLTWRQQFFLAHPHEASLFFHALLQPPKHLLAEIKEARRDLDAFSRERYQNMLGALSLRDGITEQMALEYFSVFLEMFNGYFQSKAEQGGDYQTLTALHEEKLAEILDIVLYGIAKQN